MAEAALKTLDSFNCPICLDLLKDPVAIPCGHSFCLDCIEGCWAQDDQSGVYSCPQCRHSFTPRPVLNKNTMLAELAEGLRKTRLKAAPPAGSPAGSGDVECDVCTGSKLRAVKSCLVCLASYCEAHIQPHYESPALKKHKLAEASMNLQEKICSVHDKLLEIFCRTDQQCICYLCVMDEHSGHKTVSAAAERSEKQKQLVENQRKFQQRIQQTENKLQELRQAMDNLRCSAQAAVEDSEKIFTELIESIERRRSEVKELIRAQEKTELSQAEDLLKKLEQEIADLRRRDAELEQLSRSEDHIHFLQSFQSFSAPPQPADLPRITISPQFSVEELRKAVAGVIERVSPEGVKFSGGVVSSSMTPDTRQRPQVTHQLPEPKTRQDFLKCGPSENESFPLSQSSCTLIFWRFWATERGVPGCGDEPAAYCPFRYHNDQTPLLEKISPFLSADSVITPNIQSLSSTSTSQQCIPELKPSEPKHTPAYQTSLDYQEAAASHH
ncbi:hypothetical protein AOLI_G00069090 [Acnodon oligacanthus]